ncbi:Sialic acid-specific 9-O-acetylesterase [Acidisarcina polymorpha]|uniref:Sialic acid-specific 9-O-acetylesterase n=1 Tax=Acidisarcina polymorpha TaxID=2211140 RepID=A0A2Z5FTH0_9BACT|nr:sialate O-acetylesterase [Acidisarcina polymorpha]AXC10123.1 Sialic acid-specific 9-O-acetylesterase [Acidisarcina polymorpha]
MNLLRPGSAQASTRRPFGQMPRIRSRFVVLACGIGLMGTHLSLAAQDNARKSADRLPLISPIFGDNMVVQRNKPETLWGWSDPGDTIRISFAGKTATATAAEDGRWTTTVEPPSAGGPYTMEIAGHRTTELHNVLVGDVWLCAGQSNMEFALRGLKDAQTVIAAANNPEIRYFTVAQRSAYHPATVPEGSWKVVSPQTADRLSAVAYLFAARLQAQIHVPIGLVVDAVGGTPAETWMSESALHQLAGFDPVLATLHALQASGTPEYGNYVMPWYDQYDIGMKDGWSQPSFDDATWKRVTLPGGFAQLGTGNFPALAYFRRNITLPATIAPGHAMLLLGIVERMDTVYVNGKQIGGSAWVENPRAYPVPPGLLKPGENSVAVRVLRTKPDGGFQSKADDLRLVLGDGTKIPLAGEWKARVSVDAKPPQPLPVRFENWPVVPTVLYQGMVAPLAPLSITGAIWYQGEANSEEGYEYRKVLPALIADWRRTFAQGDFPFYIAGLPAYRPPSATPTDDTWAETRESHALAAATVPHTCLAVTIDTGDPDTIHPKDKAPVADRLARCALAEHYGKPIPDQGPTLVSSEIATSAILLRFSHADGGLVIRGNAPGAFQIAGADRKWIWADAHIVDGVVVVSSSLVQFPTQVRYAWQSNPNATLFNGIGLPASPFRTDDWPLMTQDRPVY